MAEGNRVFSRTVQGKILDLFNRAVNESDEGLLDALERNIKSQIYATRLGSNPSYAAGKLFAYNPVASVSKPIGRLYREQERFSGVMAGSGWAGKAKGGTLADMRLFYGRQERIDESFRNHFAMMANNSGVGNAGPGYVNDETWKYQLGLLDSGVSSDFSYLRDHENEQTAKRNAAARRAAQVNNDYQVAMMDDFERSIHNMMEGGFTREQAENVYVRQNAKWLSIIAKNNPKIAKHIPAIAKTLGNVTKIPGVGLAAANPVGAGLLLAGLGFSRMNESRKSVASWEAAESYFGHPPAELARKMKGAGVGDEGAVIKSYGKMASWLADLGIRREAWDVMADVALASGGKVNLMGIGPHSTPEDLAKTLIPQMKNLDFNEKLRTLNALGRAGINENVLKGFENYITGSETTSQAWTGLKQEKKDWATRVEAEHPIASWLGPSWYKVPLLGDIMTQVDKLTDWIWKSDSAKAAASSADRYDAGDFASAAPADGTEGGKGTNSTVTVILQTEDGKVISKRTMAAGKKFEDRVAIADMFDTGGQ